MYFVSQVVLSLGLLRFYFSHVHTELFTFSVFLLQDVSVLIHDLVKQTRNLKMVAKYIGFGLGLL